MRRVLTILAGLQLALVFGAAPARAGVGYSVIVDDPRGVARGTVVVRAHVTGGVGDAEFAAYRLGGGWVSMEKTGEGSFASSSSPWATEGLPNGDYQLAVRVWGEVPAYDASDPKTFAEQIVTVSVDNAPPAPHGVRARAADGGIDVSWPAVATAGRGDFRGYRVLAARGPCGGAAYHEIAETSATALTQTDVRPGTWCYRVVALRASTVSGEIASAPSAVASVVLRAADVPSTTIPDGFGGVGATGDEASGGPPKPPALGDGSLEVSDGSFVEDLPYGPQTVTQRAEGSASDEIEGLASDEPGVGPRQAVSLVAAGLILATFALLLRRFLASAPER